MSFQAEGVSEVTSAVDQVQRKIEDSAAATQALGGALAAVAAAGVLAFKNALGTTMDFDKQLSAIASVGGKEAQAQMERIRETAIQLGADTSFSASEAAAGMEEMIKAGLSVEDTLSGAAQAVLDLSAASGTPVEESATIMSNILNVYSRTMQGFESEGEKAIHIADLLSQAANASATDVHGMGLAFQASGTVARAYNIDVDTLATSLAILAQNGLQGSDMGTSLKTMLLSLSRETKPAKAALAELGLTFDSFKDSAGEFIGIEAMFELFRQGAAEAGISGMELNRIFNQVFGSDAVRAANIFFNTTEEGWDAMEAGMDNAGTAADQAGVRLDNLAGDWEVFQGAIESLTLTVMQFTQGPLREVVQRATEFVQALIELPPELQQTAVIVAAVGTALAGAAGGWMLFGDKIKLAIKGMKLFAFAAKGMLLSPIGLVIGALTALGLAYVNNFAGFKDFVDVQVGRIGDAFTRVSDFIDTLTRNFQVLREMGMNPLEAAFGALRNAADKTFGRGNPLSNFADVVREKIGGVIDTVTEFVDRFRGAFEKLRRAGFNPVRAAVAAFTNALAGMTDNPVLEFIADLINSVAVLALQVGRNLLPYFEKWRNMALQVRDAFTQGGLGAAIQKVLDLLPDFGGDMLELGGRFIEWIWNGVKENAPKVWNWFTQTFIPEVATRLGTLASEGWAAAQGLLEEFRSFLQENGPKAWEWFTDELIPGIVEALGGLIGAGANAANELLKDFRLAAFVYWRHHAKPWFQNLPNEILGMFFSGGPAMENGATSLLGAFWEKAKEVWGTILNWVTDTALPFLGARFIRWKNIIGEVAGTVFGAFWASAKIAWAGIVYWAEHTALPALGDALGGLKDWLGQVATTAFANFKLAATNAWNMITFWLTSTALPALVDALGGLKDTLLEKGAEIVGNVKDGLMEAWPGIHQWITEDGLPNIVEALTVGVAQLMGVGPMIIGTILNGIIENRTAIYNFFKDVLIPGILVAIGAPLVILHTVGQGIMTGLWNGLKEVWNSQLGPWLSQMGQMLLSRLGDVSEWLLGKGQEISTGLQRGIQEYFDKTIAVWFAGLKQKLIDKMAEAGEAVEWLKGIGLAILNGLKAGAEEGWTALGTWFGGTKDRALLAMTEGAGTAAEWLKETGANIVGGLLGAIQTTWSSLIVPWFEGLPGTIVAFFANAGEWLKEAGLAIVQGLWDGVKQKWDEFTGWFGEQIGKLPGMSEEKLEIESPSKVFARIGAQIPAGLALGISQGMPEVERALQDQLHALVMDTRDATRGLDMMQPTNWSGTLGDLLDTISQFKVATSDPNKLIQYGREIQQLGDIFGDKRYYDLAREFFAMADNLGATLNSAGQVKKYSDAGNAAGQAYGQSFTQAADASFAEFADKWNDLPDMERLAKHHQVTLPKGWMWMRDDWTIMDPEDVRRFQAAGGDAGNAFGQSWADAVQGWMGSFSLPTNLGKQNTHIDPITGQWVAEYDKVHDLTANPIQDHFTQILGQGEYLSDFLTEIPDGHLKDVLKEIGKDMSDGMFTGWRHYIDQYGSDLINPIMEAFNQTVGLFKQAGLTAGSAFSEGMSSAMPDMGTDTGSIVRASAGRGGAFAGSGSSDQMVVRASSGRGGAFASSGGSSASVASGRSVEVEQAAQVVSENRKLSETMNRTQREFAQVVDRFNTGVERIASGEGLKLTLMIDGQPIAAYVQSEIVRSFGKSRENVRPAGRTGI